MKLTINGYEVDITATREGSYDKEEDTMYFLNRIGVLASLSRERNEQCGCYALAKEDKRIQNDIHDFLDSKGFFDR